MPGLQLTTLPETLWQLTVLRELNLSNNQLITLPEALGKLKALQWLDLSNNQLSTLPEALEQLTALETLSLSNNELTTLPEALWRLTALRGLYLHNNPGLGLPAEVLGPTWQGGYTSTHAQPKPPLEILDVYFRLHAAGAKRPILEAKVIFVGWGAVGKTSLRRRLVDGTFDPEEYQTHKIEITPWPVRVERDAVKLHLWDFGGQEIMHATHQFFLTKRSLYVLVLAGREKVQGAQDAEYWLRLIASFGGNSPVLVVLNKQLGCPFDLNREMLREKYPSIRGFVLTDCEPPLGLTELKARILTEVDRLPELRTEFDTRWMAIKDAVTGLKRKGRKRIALTEYLEVCSTHNEKDQQWQRWLLSFLHDLGVVLWFQNDERLSNDGVLDPQWVVDGIYRIINEPTFKAGDGQVTRAQIRALLSTMDYTDDDVRVLLDLMEKFELCFPFEDSGTTVVMPELMTEQQAEWKPVFPDLERCLRFELHYDFLPDGLTRKNHGEEATGAGVGRL